jgi:hypothetical protein
MMNSSGAKELLDGGLIKVFSGTAPASADAAQTGTVLWTISVNGAGTGLTWTSASGEISKAGGTVWQGATTAGTATYFRVIGSADTGALSTTEPRIQGSVGVSATNDMVLSSTTFVTDAATNARVLGAASFVLPTL